MGKAVFSSLAFTAVTGSMRYSFDICMIPRETNYFWSFTNRINHLDISRDRLFSLLVHDNHYSSYYLGAAYAAIYSKFLDSRLLQKYHTVTLATVTGPARAQYSQNSGDILQMPAPPS